MVGPLDNNTLASILTGWLHQGHDLSVSQKCHLPYNIKLFTQVLYDVAPLEVFYVLLGQPYLWKRHVVYEYKPLIVLITLGRQLDRVLEVAPLTAISLISAKQCSKIISHNGKFVFFLIFSQSKGKILSISSALRKGSFA